MCDKNELAGFDRRLVFYDAVFGNAEAEKPRTEGTDPSHDDCSLQGRDDPVDNGAGRNNGPGAWDDEERRNDEHAPHLPQYFILSPVRSPHK